jgi:glutathione S-transferase
MTLTVHGASYSVYSRILRLALAEKGVGHRWVETDVFGADRDAQTARHPFGKIPSLVHDGFALYETGACVRYLEQPAFGPVRLMPDDPRQRARADQIACIVDGYGYRAMVWDTYVELRKPSEDKAPEAKASEARASDPATVERGLATAAIVLASIEGLMDGGGGTLVGAAPSHADLFLAPVLAYFDRTDPGHAMLAKSPRLAAWWAAWQARPSMAATRYPSEG